MNKKNKIIKIEVLVVLFILVVASAVASIIKNNDEYVEKISINKEMNVKSLSQKIANVWEDEFNDETKIDPDPPGEGLSENYVVENGEVKIINTCSAWTDPAWTRMKPITIINNAGQPLQDYQLFLTVEYDADMQPDYDDIRFKHEENPGTWLDYWIENRNENSVNVWIKISSIPVGESFLYLFYGNPSAIDQSDFDSVFPDWDNEWSSDVKISNHANNEGAWDPDVAYGNNRFLVAWEEGTYLYPPYSYFFRQEIRGSIFDIDGNILVNDFEICGGSGLQYRYENPSIAFGGGKFFVAWEHYNTPTNPSTMDIKGRLVTTSGGTESLITICSQSDIQADPNVEFDTTNERFCVVWEDARNGASNYNVYGKLYDTDGDQIGGEKTICSDPDGQIEPWVAFDNINNHYMIVWEEGETPNNGPFDIWVGLFDSSLNLIGPDPGPSPVKLADGDPNTDYNFPCVSFCEETERFLVTWNDGDISDGDWWGNVWGTILDSSGDIVIGTFQIRSGDFVRTDIVPYLRSSFLVSYDDTNRIRGKIITSDGEIISDEIILSAGGSAEADWANMAVGNGKIFLSWEDIRVSYPYPWNNNPDAFGNIWYLDIPDGSEINYNFGVEQELVLSAFITSIAIETENLTIWDEFNAIFSGDITFDILDGDTGSIILHDVTSGQNIQSILAPSIRLMASFHRLNPSFSPILDKWNVSWISNRPPNIPTDPYPENGAIDVDVEVDLSWTGGDPDPGDTVTYDVYFGTVSPPPKIISNQSATTYDPGTLGYETTYFWQIISWDNYDVSAAGPIWSFTTAEEPNQPPYIPSNPDPPNHATDVDINADLSWTGGDPDPGDTVTYDVYFGTVSPPPKVESNQSETTYDPGTMSHDTTYYWQIIAWDSHGVSSSGPIWDFTTEFAPNNPPYEPSNPDPPNHAIDVDIDADLSWTGGDPDPGDTVTYDVYFGTISPPPLVVYNHSDTTYDQGVMNYNTMYYWQIIAWDNRGASTPGPIWDFTTEEEVNNPPYLPSDPDPPNYATDVSIDADLSWTGGDPDPGDTVTYDVYFGDVSPPPKVESNQSETTYDPGTMTHLTAYYWQIIAWDDHDASTEGSIWSFTTEESTNQPPEKPTISGPPNGTVWAEYEFTFVTTDPENENISYFVDWGDDNNTGWIGPYPSGEIANATHSWTEQDTYYVKVKAKDEHEAESEWSDPLIINITLFDLKPTFILGFIKNVSTSGDYIEFNADTALFITFIPFGFNILMSNEKIVASQEYIGGIIKANTSIIFGLFEAALLNSSTIGIRSIIKKHDESFTNLDVKANSRVSKASKFN